MKKISCIIPTCDRPNYLEQAVGSVLNQTVAAHEIIVISNGKKPVTLSPATLSRVIVFNILPYAGVAQARNFGACVATGDYLAFLDDDDLWVSNYLEGIEKAVGEDDEKIIISRLDKITGNEITPHRCLEQKATINNLLTHNPGVTGTNLAISKKIFFDLSGYDPKLPPTEDKSLIIEALKKGYKIITLPDNQAILRIHEGERLTNPKKMAEGIFQFIRKYSHIMNTYEYLYNLKKLFRYQYKSGEKTAAFKYLIIGIILSVMRIFKK
jgi:glycosyltransferase involved in cell wall biosynthesis